MLEHFFQCPYCWEQISILVDSSISSQNYVEDCEVCCNPIDLTLNFVDRELVGFGAKELGQ